MASEQVAENSENLYKGNYIHEMYLAKNKNKWIAESDTRTKNGDSSIHQRKEVLTSSIGEIEEKK